MFSLLIVLSSFSEFLATKCLLLNDETWMVRATLINMNHDELKYYPFIISLHKGIGSCKFLSSKICVPKSKRHKC